MQYDIILFFMSEKCAYIAIYTSISHFLYPFVYCWAPRLILHQATVTSATINMGKGSLWYAHLESFRYIPGMVQLGHVIALYSVFGRSSVLLSIETALVYIPTSSEQASSFPTSSPGFVVCFLHDSQSAQGQMESQCNSGLHFLDG